MDKNQDSVFRVGALEINTDPDKQTFDPASLPVLALRDAVLFPGVTFPVSLSREASMQVAKRAEADNLLVGVFCQRDPAKEQPKAEDLYDYGVLAQIIKVFDMPDDSHTAIVRTRGRVRITAPAPANDVCPLNVAVNQLRDTGVRSTDAEFAALRCEIRDTTMNILRKSGEPNAELADTISHIDADADLINIIATHAPLPAQQKVEMLAKSRLKERARLLLTHLARNEHYAEIRDQVRQRARQKMDEQQHRYFLQSQYDALREELYGAEDDTKPLRDKLAKLALPDDTRKIIEKELAKLDRINPQSSDWGVQYGYIELLTQLPWGVYDPLSTSLPDAQDILDQDHYGLEKVKERILEQLAVLMNTPDGRSPILCLVGAPGVGKTSLGRSIARALGRKYQRVSLGGMHDEAEIRGHRRTYVGAMPGRIIDAVRRAGTSNPVLLLDEIDKTGSDFKGDPSAALLEVLDPEQNCRFHDNYVDVDYDLSHVLFIATANTLQTLAQPLLDRMEIIDISGYLMEEKIEIARRHLIPRVARENGFADGEVQFDADALTKIIDSYTSESGVRQLEKRIASVVRKIVLKKMRGLDYDTTVHAADLRDYLGVERYTREKYNADATPGVATGLAWTAVGGEILFIEASLARVKGEKLTLTGNLGDVMKESAVIAQQYVRSHATDLKIAPELFEDHTIHIHVPEGAVPKDGPSAGITIATALVSALTRRPVRPRLAMTGEITLRGKVLPVGGIKEKILAAKRAGIDTIVLSQDNRKDIEDIKAEYISGLTFHYVKTVDQVLELALE